MGELYYPKCDGYVCKNESKPELPRPEIPRGKYRGERRGGPPQSEAEHFYQCAACGGWVDMRDLGAVFDHEPGGSHPATRAIAPMRC